MESEISAINILHISALPVWPLEGKGGMPSLRETLHGHVRHGHSVLLVLPRYNVLGDRAYPISIKDHEGFETHLVPCSWAPFLASVRRAARKLGGGNELPYPIRWFLNLTLCFLLTTSFIIAIKELHHSRKREFDLVYAHNQYAALAGWLTGKILRIPNVSRLYGTFLADLIKKPLVWLRYPVASAGFLIPHSLLICANDGTRGAEVAKKLGIDMCRFRFWQNGVDFPEQPPKITRKELLKPHAETGLRKDSCWVISCSRLSYWKHIDRILHALAYARSAGCDCQLLVAGAGPEKFRLANLVQRLNIANNVIWLGTVEHKHIWELMNVADVFMITNDVTNRCNPLFEAICAGLPVISVYDPSTNDILKNGENALLANKDDRKGLGENLLRICSDADLSAKLRYAQQASASNFLSWAKRMDKEVRELEKLVSETSCNRK